MKNETIGKDEKVCYNCKHMAWLVGIGQGVKCTNPQKEPRFFNIPNRRHTCDLFEIPKMDKKEGN